MKFHRMTILHSYNIVLLLWLISTGYSEKSREQGEFDVKKPRCGGLDHSLLTRPCQANDTSCGQWFNRYWHPTSCEYQDITSEQARKCIGNHTIAFIGDSLIRDISMGVVHLLLGKYTLETAPTEKFEYRHQLTRRGDSIPQFPHWKHNPGGGNGYIFPKNGSHLMTKRHRSWQIQYWSLYNMQLLENNQPFEILNNTTPKYFSELKKIDLAFWEVGLHNLWWETDGEQYFDKIVKSWLDIRLKVCVPSIWVSMNPHCERLMKLQTGPAKTQHIMVEQANWYTNRRTLKEKLPYWDAGAVLRNKEVCDHSDDGVHVKMYVDIMRAKMLFNHLCDSDMNWRGSAEIFI